MGGARKGPASSEDEQEPYPAPVGAEMGPNARSEAYLQPGGAGVARGAATDKNVASAEAAPQSCPSAERTFGTGSSRGFGAGRTASAEATILWDSSEGADEKVATKDRPRIPAGRHRNADASRAPSPPSLEET